MQNSDSQKQVNLEESKENKADISKETETSVNDLKRSKLNESNAHVIKVLQNSNVHTGKNNFYICPVVFGAMRPLCVTY